MFATVPHPMTILLAVLLLVAAPAQADSIDETVEADGSTTVDGNATSALAATGNVSMAAEPTGNVTMAIESTGGFTMTAEATTGDTQKCQLVDYSLSKPTAITPDPDRCFIPYIISQIPI